MSDLPRAVQAQLDQAEALQAQIYGQTAPEQGNTAAPEIAEAQTAEQPAQTVVQETQVTQQQPSTDWEQRFNVLRGKYDAELPRLHQQNRELSERLEQAIKMMEAKQEPKADKAKLVTDADVEAYGEDLVDMVRRASREEFDALATKLVGELDKRFGAVSEKVERTEQRVAKSAADKFWDVVTAPDAAPDFDAINDDPRWFAFLDARVPGSRFARRALAEDAINNLDSVALLEQIKAFRDSIGVAPTPAPTKAKQNLNAQVAPSSSKASAPSDSSQARTYSGAEYASALDHRNLQRMSREDYERGVAEAELALAEGRVRF